MLLELHCGFFEIDVTSACLKPVSQQTNLGGVLTRLDMREDATSSGALESPNVPISQHLVWRWPFDASPLLLHTYPIQRSSQHSMYRFPVLYLDCCALTHFTPRSGKLNVAQLIAAVSQLGVSLTQQEAGEVVAYYAPAGD